MQLKRGLNVAITRNALTQNLATRGRKCDDTHQYCSNTNGCFNPRKPVASKQPTCVESEQEVNKVNGKLTETVRDWRHGGRHTPPFYSRHNTTTRPHLLVEGRASSSSGAVESVGPNETVQQGVRVGVRLLVVDRDEGNLEDGVGEIGVLGEVG